MAGKTFNAYLYISADGFDEDVTLEESNFNVLSMWFTVNHSLFPFVIIKDG